MHSHLRRHVYVTQRDEKDCGPACICSLCAYYEISLSMAKARELCKADSQGTNVYGMVQALEELGFQVDPLIGSPDELEQGISSGEFVAPFIAHVVTPELFEHYVVVFDIGPNSVAASDPAVGKRIYSKREFLDQWTGVVIMIKPTENLSQGYEREGGLNIALALVGANKRLVASVVLLSLILAAIGIASAFVFQYVIDGAIAGASLLDRESVIGSLVPVFGAVLVLFAIQAALTSVRGYCLSKFANKLDVSIMLGFHHHLLDLPMGFFGTRKTGEILSRFSDAAKIREAISSITFTALIDCIMVAAGVIMLWAVSWVLACIAFTLFAAYAFVMLAYMGKLEKNNKLLMESNAQLNSIIKEHVDGIETVKSFSQESSIKAKVSDKFSKLIEIGLRQAVMSTNQSAIVGFLSSAATIVILWVGAIQVIDGELTLGALITFNALLGYFLAPLQRIVELQPQIQSAIIAMDRLNDINEVAVEDVVAGDKPPSSLTPIAISSVSFRYGYRDLVLDRINLSVQKGDKIGLVGESGSGKTTLSKLLLGFYEPEDGFIRFNGADASKLRKDDIRKRIAYLSQETYLFFGSIAENIKFGNPDATDEELMEVCERCKVTAFTEKFALGLDSIVEERGANLSGGQKQRIALARVLIRKPEILVLDEATSNLDSITEKAIVEAIFEDEQTTCLLIAHRLSTIIGCDKIALMEDGRVVEFGSHENLLDEGGKYFQYWSNQPGA